MRGRDRTIRSLKRLLVLNFLYIFSKRLNYFRLQALGKKIELNLFCIDAVKAVQDKAYTIYEDKWNYYSNALTNDVVKSFYETITFFENGKLDYLEIGSAQGLSLGIVGEMLKRMGKLGKLVSIDPYFDDGYFEGAGYFNAESKLINIKSSTRDSAISFRKSLDLHVEQIKETSHSGLVALLKKNRKFDIIYIDGAHEGLIPLIDLGLSTQLLKPDGVILLDDYHWTDVEPLKKLCDKYCYMVSQSHKTVAYRMYK